MPGSPRRRTRRLAVLAILVAAAALVAGTAGAARQNQDDPRNFSYGLIQQGSQNDCWIHHRVEGMYDAHIVVPIFPKAIKLGEPAELQVQIENSWIYEIAAYTVKLNLVGNDSHIVPLIGSAAESPSPYTTKWAGSVGNPEINDGPVSPPGAVGFPPKRAWHNFTVGEGAVAIVAKGEFYWPPNPGGASDNRALFFSQQPQRTQFPPWPGNDLSASVWNYTILTPQPGEWSVGAEYRGGSVPELRYGLNVTVFYRSAGANEHIVREQFRSPAEGDNPTVLIPPRGVSDIISIPILGFSEGRQIIEVNVTALLYFNHQAGGTPDEDIYYRVAVGEIVVGQEFIASDVEAATAGTVQVDFYLMSGEVTGFASAFLLIPSLLLGGTYGRASRKFLNDILGGAKRRVMFHNLASLGLTLVAVLHIILFLLEVRYTVMMGVLWGGLGALTLLILGVTGYYQVPLIQKYGYNWWRNLHLVTGILVVAFVIWHSIQDGPDFYFLKEQMPTWAQDFNWARTDSLK